jgi:Flp pilus assembly protein TadD
VFAAHRLDPAGAAARNSLGDVLGATNRLAEAESEYREAIRLAPANTKAHQNLIQLLRVQGKRREAEEAERLATQT